MSSKRVLYLIASATMAVAGSPALASEAEPRSFERTYFDQFAPQTALEMLERLPGYSLEDADEARGLGQGGTNVLVNGEPVTGKGRTARARIAQIAASNVVRIEILDGASLGIPGFDGLVANIVTRRASLAGTVQWEPSFRQNTGPAYGNGTLSVSGSAGSLDYSAALDIDMVSVLFEGPETISNEAGEVYETRDEAFTIRGVQPDLSGGIVWRLSDGHVLNAKASMNRLDIKRGQASESAALTPLGREGSSIAETSGVTDDLRFDADYSFPAFDGTFKGIVLARRRSNDAKTRFTLFDALGGTIADRAFEEDSTSSEGVVRLEQQWIGRDKSSWQLAAEGAFNSLHLATDLLDFSTDDPGQILTSVPSETRIEELRGELTFGHQRQLGENSSIQASIGGELSEIGRSEFKRSFFRPKGFVAYTFKPGLGWSVSARLARQVGQINFRDFAANVSLIDGVETQDNLDLVPQQSWVVSGRTDRVFENGHTFYLAIAHERISDLVDRIPLGANGDAIGNISRASKTRIDAGLTLTGTQFGLTGAQLDLDGTWQWSAVSDPIEGFERDISNLRKRELAVRFRHDLAQTDWSYGFELRDIKLAPVFRATLIEFRNVPGGALTPGTNAVFIEHKDVFGLRARLQLSEFLGQKSKFRRNIYTGRRDGAAIARIEDRERSLGGPIVSLSLGYSF